MANNISAALYDSLKARYESAMADSYARLLIYFESPVAIGEHPQFTDEMDKLLEQHASASDKLESLNAMFNNKGEGKAVKVG